MSGRAQSRPKTSRKLHLVTFNEDILHFGNARGDNLKILIWQQSPLKNLEAI
jgi:hypothetical protein